MSGEAMSCEQFRELARDLLVGEDMNLAVIEEAFAHAESCGACDAFMSDQESLTVSLRMLAARTAAEQAPPRVEQALLAALATRRAEAERARRPKILVFAAALLGVAAVLVLTLTWHRKAAAPIVAPAVPPAAAADASSPYEVDALTDDDLVADADTVAASFTPLSSTFDPTSLDGEMIVRVVLSPDALESLGVPVSEDGDGQVVADLVVASDGVPQAIRVVNQ